MPRHLKIGLLLDSSLDLEDGVQQYVMSVGEWLRSRGHDVHYLVGQTEKRQLPNIHSLSRNFVVKFNGNRINLPLWGQGSKIRALFRQPPFDVMYVQAPFHPLMAQQVILSAPRQTVIVGSFNILPHSKFVAYANKALRLLLRPSLKRIDKMLAVSPAAARYEEWAFGLPATVSPNVFNYTIFHDAQPLPKYEDGVPVILFLGRLVPRKGCHVLLAAVAELKRREKSLKFRVVICGKGPLLAKLQAYARENSLEDTVEFVGFVSDEDKPRYYVSSTITVFPSSGGESFGIVLLEGMAGGKSVVLAGNNPGYRSVMEPQPSLLFDPHDVSALAERLRSLLVDDAQRQQYAAWGASYTKQFDVNVIGRQLEASFMELHEKKSQHLSENK